MATVGRDPVAPLLAVNRPELTIVACPFVPNADAAILQPIIVGLAAQKPQQLDEDRADMKFLGRDKRETLLKIEAHLVAECAQRADASAVGLRYAMVENVPNEVVILLHHRRLKWWAKSGKRPPRTRRDYFRGRRCHNPSRDCGFGLFTTACRHALATQAALADLVVTTRWFHAALPRFATSRAMSP